MQSTHKPIAALKIVAYTIVVTIIRRWPRKKTTVDQQAQHPTSTTKFSIRNAKDLLTLRRISALGGLVCLLVLAVAFTFNTGGMAAGIWSAPSAQNGVVGGVRASFSRSVETVREWLGWKSAAAMMTFNNPTPVTPPTFTSSIVGSRTGTGGLCTIGGRGGGRRRGGRGRGLGRDGGGEGQDGEESEGAHRLGSLWARWKGGEVSRFGGRAPRGRRAGAGAAGVRSREVPMQVRCRGGA